MRMSMASVTIRMDEQTKRAASDVVVELGFDMSSVTRAFYRQIARERRVPLSLDLGPLPSGPDERWEELDCVPDDRDESSDGTPDENR